MSAVRGTRTPSPFPRITGFRDRPGTSCGITAKSTRGGIRTRKSLRTHSSGPCLYNHFHAPGQNIKYRRRGANPQNPASKAGTYSSSVTPAKVPLVRFELTVDLSPARVLSPAHIPFCYRGMSTPGEIRTHTAPGLNRLPLPVGIRELKVGRVGVAPTMFLMCLIYSQVPSLLGIPAHNKSRLRGVSPDRRLIIYVSSDKAHGCLCFTGVFSHAK